MATTAPVSSPQDGSPSQTAVPLLIDDVDHHHQFLNSNSPPLLTPHQPQDLLSAQLHPPPEVNIIDGQPPLTPSILLPPPPTESEQPPELLNPNHESPILRNSPPPGNVYPNRESPISMPPIRVEDYAECPSYDINPDHESSISRNSPPLPTSTIAEQSPENLNPNHDSPIYSQPPSPSTGPELPPENLNPNHKSPISNQSPSPSTLPTAAEEHDINPNPEFPISKQPSSPSQTGDEDHVPRPNYHVSPNPNHESSISKSPPPPQTGAEDTVQSSNYSENPSPSRDSPTLKQPPSPLPSTPSIGAEDQDHVESANHCINPSPKPHDSPIHISPSPPLTAASPASHQDTPELTPPPPLGVPLYLPAAVGSAPSRPQISPWTHEETANLIQAYQEKWYSLKKGPLKAGQWEEVAITVAARCGYDEPTKTAKQCRHKIEKLRKRYRAERGKPRSKANAWNFFKLMDNLEKGPLPISSSRPMALVEYEKPSNSNAKKRKNEEFEVDDEYPVNRRSSSRAKNSNHHVANGGLARNIQFPERVVRGLRTPMVHKRKGFYQEQRDVDDEEEEHGVRGDEGEGVGAQLAAEIKGFAEKFVKMENKKIEMIRDVERYRLEMENKRVEMILESQQMLVETVNNAFS